MKKIIALLLCCLLCLSLFACGSKSDADQPADGDHLDEIQPSESEDISAEDAQPSESEDVQEEVQPSESVDDHSDHAHVNYKGITSGAATLADVEAVEGKAPDFSFEANGVTYYAYNKVTFDSLQFDQVQFSFNEGYVRISCTRTTEEDPTQIYNDWQAYMEGTFGQPSQISENENVFKWTDGHTKNYITLTQLNETTVQLCYYLVA